MARIPTAQELGRIVPQRSQAFVPGPRDILGPAVRDAGRALGQAAQVVFRAEERQALQAEQRQRFGAQTSFLNFQNQRNQALVDAGEAAEPGAFGFTGVAALDYDRAAKDFLQTIPPDLKPEYDAKLVQLRNQVFTKAGNFEREQSTNFYNAELDEVSNQAGLAVRREPALLKEQIGELTKAINASGLTPTDKQERIKAMQPALVAEAVLGLAEAGDYDAAQDLLDQYVDAAVQRQTAAPSAIGLIRQEEGFRTEPYWDVNAWRVGYGSDTITRADGTVVRVQPGMTVTKLDAARDLNRRLGEFEGVIIGQVGNQAWGVLPGNVQAGLLSVAYNYGSLPKSVVAAVQTNDVGAIATAVGNLSANKDRRQREAAIIRGEGAVADVDIDSKWYGSLQTKITKAQTDQINDLSTETRNDYSLSIARDPANVSEEQIFNDLNLQNDDKVALIKELRSANKEQRTLQDAIRNFAIGPQAFNEYDRDSRKQVDALFEDRTDGDLTNPDTIVRTDQIVSRTGVTPRPVMRQIQSGLNSNNIDDMARAGILAERYYNMRQQSFNGADGAKSVIDAATDWTRLTRELGLSQERAAQEMIDARDPEKKRDRGTLDKQSAEILEDMSPGSIVSEFGEGIVNALNAPDVGYTNAQALSFFGDFNEVYQLNYRDTGGNEELAMARTVRDMSRLWSVSEFSGEPGLGFFDSGSLTKYAVEQYFRPIEGGWDYVREQMATAASEAFGREIDGDDLILVPDEVTRSRIEGGEKPAYRMFYKTEELGVDVYNPIPSGIYFVPSEEEGAAMARERRREEAQRIHQETIERIGTPEGYISAVDIDGKTYMIDPEERVIVEKDETGKYVPTERKYRRAVITRPDGSFVLGGITRKTIQMRLAEEEAARQRRQERYDRIRAQQKKNFQDLGFEESPLRQRFGIGAE